MKTSAQRSIKGRVLLTHVPDAEGVVVVVVVELLQSACDY